ncbi:TonB-dependent receptor [Sunxiuqinia elliptica]|uniref:TonB-linked outer membrane protein, SusC/RagA family n=1 Tax=Sunxiuqinia elliptica TaxID=655355 RepID=A0A1I2IH10_9BACT|nr:TonB-dependent receptor [Sunxiuqinia elliptica]SFF40928.1 TonB-linked outer membrane protein, SusC/RagA family [Sunxiuqinia elliptica]
MEKISTEEDFIKSLRKIFFVMRLTLFLVIFNAAFAYSISSYSQNTRLSIKLEHATVKEVLKDIESQSEFIFFYQDQQVNTHRKVNINVSNKNIDEILDLLLKGTDNSYIIRDRQISIGKLPNNSEPSALPLQDSTEKILKGKITDEKGLPLPGAAITISGTTRGVMTDIDGSFQINVSPGNKLIFSFIGMTSETLEYTGQQDVNITLKEDSQELKDVVVVAYGKQRKESVIGAITSVKVPDLRMPVGKLSTSLAGQLAGIVAVQRSGEPGSGADFWIRGVSTFGANNRPLVLVDGIERSLDLVDVEDIETFSILKDATATAVYGVRGANGVVLVTTRKGKTGKPLINIKAETGLLSPTRMPEMANAEQFIDLYNEVHREANKGRNFYSEEAKQKYLNGSDPDLYPNIDWLNEIYKNVTTSNRLNASVSGGGKIANFYVSGSVYRENGIFDAIESEEYNPSLNWTKYSFRSNIDIKLHRNTILNLNLSNQYEIKNRPNTTSLWLYSFQTVPIAIPKIYSDGSLAKPDIGQNPYNLLNNTGYVQIFNNNAQSLIGITQDFSELITPGLKANIKFSWDAYNSASIIRKKNPTTYYAIDRDTEGNLILKRTTDGGNYMTFERGNAGTRTTYLEASLTYNRVFNGNHRVGGLFLFNQREHVNNFPTKYVYSLPYRNMGIAGRITYAFRDKYFAEGNFGYNGSENFSPGKQYGFFPSIALGYLLSSENFFLPLNPIINTLKLKGSYGTIGNDKIGGGRRFAFNPEMQDYNSFTFGEMGQSWIRGLATGYPGNPHVSWEKAKKFNIGIEVGLFNKLNIQADYFHELRDGIFIERESVPSIVGINVAPYVNLGKMENKGIDASMDYREQIGDLFISARANFTFNRNKKLYDDKPTPIMAYKSQVGKPLYQQFGLVAIGYFESEEDIQNSPVQQYGPVRPGDLKYRDINGDMVVNASDIVPIGRTSIPEINYGFGISLAYKGIDLSLFCQGVENVTMFTGGTAINGFENSNLFLSGVYADVAKNRWKVEVPNPKAKYPRMSIYTNENNRQRSTAKQIDNSFLRLKNAELGYTLHTSISNKVGFSSIRFFTQGVNLLTLSSFKLWDPEITNQQGAVYPNMKTFTLGVNLNF